MEFTLYYDGRLTSNANADRKLITGLAVKTERLLVTGADPDEVRLLIHVRTKAVAGTIFTLSLST